MKKLMMAALLAGSMIATDQAVFAADEDGAAPTEQVGKKAKKAKKAKAAKAAAAKLTPEERRAKFLEKKTAEAVEILKKYGMDEAKAKECVEEIKAVLMPQRRPAKKAE